MKISICIWIFKVVLEFDVDIELEYINSSMIVQMLVEKGLNESVLLNSDSLHIICVDRNMGFFQIG